MQKEQEGKSGWWSLPAGETQSPLSCERWASAVDADPKREGPFLSVSREMLLLCFRILGKPAEIMIELINADLFAFI